ncbi:MAG: hypothetical protein CME71_08860 [Halobacteriovorax sp.]|nr:hypothetical protein [Halobacteriovorax sp.]|tara:strand:+ start:277 stop:525 length:249 start_codon:yes stop_codon:yes gene_type:complete
MKKLFFILLVMSAIGCQKEEKSVTNISVSSTASSEVDFLNKDKDEACDTPELTENKIVEQAMKPAKVNAGGALQGATDCEVE